MGQPTYDLIFGKSDNLSGSRVAINDESLAIQSDNSCRGILDNKMRPIIDFWCVARFSLSILSPNPLNKFRIDCPVSNPVGADFYGFIYNIYRFEMLNCPNAG